MGKDPKEQHFADNQAATNASAEKNAGQKKKNAARFLSIEFSTVRRTLTAVDHLGPEAVAALVDGELETQARERAHSHITNCMECRAEVERQRTAASRLRECDAEDVHIPASLLSKLQQLAPEDLLKRKGEDDFSNMPVAGLLRRMKRR